jgi:hypothetical protein
MAGFSAVSITETIDRREFTQDSSGLSYGFGIETVVSEHADISLDYIHYLHQEDGFEDVSGLNLGFKIYY